MRFIPLLNLKTFYLDVSSGRSSVLKSVAILFKRALGGPKFLGGTKDEPNCDPAIGVIM